MPILLLTIVSILSLLTLLWFWWRLNSLRIKPKDLEPLLRASERLRESVDKLKA